MRRLIATSLVMLLLACGGALRAQSGRNTGRPAQGASKAGDPAATPPNADAGSDEPAAKTDAPGETVEGDVVRVETTLVTVPVSVRDRDGRYAPDLRREDFKLFEEGVEQRISYFAAVDQPFTVALILDTSNSTDLRLEDMQTAAVSFVNQLKPQDRVMVVSFDDSVRVLSEPTSDRAALVKAIRRARTGGSTRLYDAVDFVIKKRLKQVTGRKAIVLFTDGVDTASSRASYGSTVRLAEELDALIYTVSYATLASRIGLSTPPTFPGGRGGITINGPFPRSSGGMGAPSRAEVERGDAYLRELSDKTGGRFYRGDSLGSITQAFEWVAEELRRQYSLGYYPSRPGQEGQRRQIKVGVNRPNLVVLSRDSYVYARKKTDAGEGDGQPSTQTDSPRKNLVGAR